LGFWCGCRGVLTLPVFCRFGAGVGAGVGVFFIFRTTSRIPPNFFRCIHDNFRTHHLIDFKFCTPSDYAKVGNEIANELNRGMPKLFLCA